jgi:hypothetical protein
MPTDDGPQDAGEGGSSAPEPGAQVADPPGTAQPVAPPSFARTTPLVAGQAARAIVPADEPRGIPIEAGAFEPDAPTYLMNGELPDARPDAPTVPMWPGGPLPSEQRRVGQRLRTWALVLYATMALLIGAGVFVLGQSLPTITTAPALVGSATLTSANAAGALAPAATATPPPTLVPPAAQLLVTPRSLVLPCASVRFPATLTLTNTGGQLLQWSASASDTVALSSTSGALDPGSAVVISVRTTSSQRGSIAFTWNGGSTSVAYKVSCH